MPEFSSTAAHGSLPRWRVAGALLLVGLLLLLGTYSPQVLAALTTGWQALLAALGLGRWSEQLQSHLPQGVARRYLPAVASYALGYMGLSLLLLRLLLPVPAQWRLVLGSYAAVFGAYLLLTMLARLAGSAPWLYQLSRHLIDFLATPLPVVALLALCWSGLTKPAQR